MSKCRCYGEGDPILADYHDNEWGIPVHNDQRLFEMLVLEGQQAGLSWELILKRRPAYRQAFHHFDPTRVALMSDQELNKHLLNPALIRNRLKIFSIRQNAQAFLQIQEEEGSFDHYLWSFVDHKPILNRWATISEVPCETPLSKKLSKDLKKRGMSFVGPTIIYSYMQAVGLVNDHPADCTLGAR